MREPAGGSASLSNFLTFRRGKNRPNQPIDGREWPARFSRDGQVPIGESDELAPAVHRTGGLVL